jgi:hypothetical protein
MAYKSWQGRPRHRHSRGPDNFNDHDNENRPVVVGAWASRAHRTRAKEKAGENRRPVLPGNNYARSAAKVKPSAARPLTKSVAVTLLGAPPIDVSTAQ